MTAHAFFLPMPHPCQSCLHKPVSLEIERKTISFKGHEINNMWQMFSTVSRSFAVWSKINAKRFSIRYFCSAAFAKQSKRSSNRPPSHLDFVIRKPGIKADIIDGNLLSKKVSTPFFKKLQVFRLDLQ